MAFSAHGGGGRGRIARSSLSEINVTPLVDVMLVLLVIFMVASAVETARISREAETLRQVVTEETAQTNRDENQVPIDLPKVKADPAPAVGKQGKPTIAMDAQKRIFLDTSLLIDCGKRTTDQCLDGFEAALHKHPKAQGLRDAALKADRHLDYGLVLALMARMRRAGIEHFGLVTEEPAPAAAPQGK
jgi:biopolymer transport protein TolR